MPWPCQGACGLAAVGRKDGGWCALAEGVIIVIVVVIRGDRWCGKLALLRAVAAAQGAIMHCVVCGVSIGGAGDSLGIVGA